MSAGNGSAGLAVHVGADVQASPQHSRWPAVRSCRDTVERMSRLCAAVGVSGQYELCGADATRVRVRDAIRDAAAALDATGLLVLTFTGHTERVKLDEHGLRDTRWCLYDGTFGFDELADALSPVPSTARVVVVVDTCYAASLARFTGWPCTLMLVAACDENQTPFNRPTSEFIVRLEELVLASPRCVSYAWLRDELQADTPDAERPQVWTNDPAAWTHRPFAVLTRVAAGDPTCS